MEPLAVAKLLKSAIDEERPGLVLCGKQTIDNEMNATGQMLAALTGLAPATTDTKNTLPRVAALLDVMMIPDISGILGDDTFVRPVFAGNAFQTVKSSDFKKVISIRTSALDTAGAGEPVPLETKGAIDVPTSANG